MENPLVSIIIPTYNRSHTLGETLDSVLNQIYPNWECIIIDDGSTDKTEELVSSYVNKDARFQFHHRPKGRTKGANACRNYGFELSKGELIQWLDSDDLLDDSKLKSQVFELANCHYTSLAICRWEYFGNKNKNITIKHLPIYKSYDDIVEFLFDLSRSYGFLPPHTYLMHRKLVLESGNWMEKLLINQDGEFFARVFTRAREIKYVSNAVVFYRSELLDNVSTINNIQKAEHAIYSWQLIENYFIIHFGQVTDLVHISKKYLYNRLKIQYPDLLLKYSTFFKAHTPPHKNIFNKFLIKIKRVLNKVNKI